MTRDEAVKAFEESFSEVKRGYNTAALPDGTPFVFVCCGGPKSIGAQTPALCDSEETAVRLWLAEAMKFSGSGKILHWRIEPEFDYQFLRWCEEDGTDCPHLKDFPVRSIVQKRWLAYSLFAVTNGATA